jgi:hypothetical protein
LKIRAPGAIVAALSLQILIISVIPKVVRGWPGPVLEVASYGLAVFFLIANRRIPWLWLVGVGGLSNLAAIGANGGVMPASPVALRAAGRVRHKGQFLNSTSLNRPHLAFLGDNFSVPHTWPLANVFSIGDVILAIGALLLLHSVCASRPLLTVRRHQARSPRRRYRATIGPMGHAEVVGTLVSTMAEARSDVQGCSRAQIGGVQAK